MSRRKAFSIWPMGMARAGATSGLAVSHTVLHLLLALGSPRGRGLLLGGGVRVVDGNVPHLVNKHQPGGEIDPHPPLQPVLSMGPAVVVDQVVGSNPAWPVEMPLNVQGVGNFILPLLGILTPPLTGKKR